MNDVEEVKPVDSDTDMVQRWMHQVHRRVPKKRGGTYLWVRVSEEFCIGSTSARGACRRHGFDPDSEVRKV